MYVEHNSPPHMYGLERVIPSPKKGEKESTLQWRNLAKATATRLPVEVNIIMRSHADNVCLWSDRMRKLFYLCDCPPKTNNPSPAIRNTFYNISYSKIRV